MGRRDTRQTIMDAAERVGRTAGFARVTTKAVAAEAGVSEASIYYHFSDRTDLLAEMVASRFAALNDQLTDLPLKGTTPERRLGHLVAVLVNAFSTLIGLSAPLLADPAVLERFRAVMAEHGVSLHTLQAATATRLRTEQSEGRLRSDVDADAVALLIAGACHEVALEGHLLGGVAASGSTTVVRRLNQTLGTMLSA